MVFFITLSFQITGASPRGCRRRPSSAAGRQDLVWGLASEILLARGFASQDKNARCGKIFAAQQHAFQLLCSPHDETIGVIRQLCLRTQAQYRPSRLATFTVGHPRAQ